MYELGATALMDGAGLHTGPALRVLHTLNPPDGTTKYVDQMVDGAHPNVEILYFTWWRALFGRYDVLHVHWPELLIRDRRRAVRFLKRRALALLLLALPWRRIPVVWTAHNVSPHEEGTAAERRSLARFTRAVTLVVRLNPTTRIDRPVPVVTILHGHYRSQFARYVLPPVERGRLLYFGIIRPYKGVDDLIAAFTRVTDPRLTLRIVGKPHPGQAEMVEDAQRADGRISSSLRFVPDSELVEEFGRAELVVLPYRETMHNSGVLLVALSLGRPVLVPASPTNEALRREVGEGWILQYDGDLGPETIADALEEVRTGPRSTEPSLAGRDWDVVGAQHYDAYLMALGEVGRRHDHGAAVAT